MQHVHEVLQPYIPLVRKLTGKNITLTRMKPIMLHIGNPQEHLRIIHIAGTSGKTSTAYYTASLLRARGAKVGLTISPHVDTVRERVQVDGEPLSEREFCSLFGGFMDLIVAAPVKPSYFELLTAFAYWAFAKLKVDYAVIETGLGGLYDATNVSARADKVCVITDIGYDHMDILGNTLAKIAYQKAGIIQEGNDVFMYRQNEEIMKVFDAAIENQRAVLHIPQIKSHSFGQDLPDFQRRNWVLALSATDYISRRDGLRDLSHEELLSTQKIRIPARMDVRQIENKLVVMDGAHNAQKMAAFIESFRQQYPDAQPVLLIAIKTDKDYEDVVPLLVGLHSRIIVTSINTTQDLVVESVEPLQLKKAFHKAGAKRVTAEPDQHKAYRLFMNDSSPIGIITGSFYLISQVRNNEHIT